jgi:hypothetical protein
MLVPRLTGYPVDHAVVQRRQRERHQRRARMPANRLGSSWAWMRRRRT